MECASGATSETAFDAGDAAALYCFVYSSPSLYMPLSTLPLKDDILIDLRFDPSIRDTDASCIKKPTYKQIIVAPSIGLVIAATMHSGFKRKRYRIGPRLRLSYMGRPLNLERFSHYVDTLDSTDVVKVVIDVAYIGDVASVFHVLAHTQE
ncbi:hypothetical protein Tco_1458580 [Tanacetum coccineum]